MWNIIFGLNPAVILRNTERCPQVLTAVEEEAQPSCCTRLQGLLRGMTAHGIVLRGRRSKLTAEILPPDEDAPGRGPHREVQSGMKGALHSLHSQLDHCSRLQQQQKTGEKAGTALKLHPRPAWLLVATGAGCKCSPSGACQASSLRPAWPTGTSVLCRRGDWPGMHLSAGLPGRQQASVDCKCWCRLW